MNTGEELIQFIKKSPTAFHAAETARQTLEAAGFPTLVLDGDGCDAGNANDGQMVTRLQAFLEQLEGRA